MNINDLYEVPILTKTQLLALFSTHPVLSPKKAFF